MKAVWAAELTSIYPKIYCKNNSSDLEKDIPVFEDSIGYISPKFTKTELVKPVSQPCCSVM